MGILCGVMGARRSAASSRAPGASRWRTAPSGARWPRSSGSAGSTSSRSAARSTTATARRSRSASRSRASASTSVEMLRGVDGEAAQEAALRDASARIGKALVLDPAELYAKLGDAPALRLDQAPHRRRRGRGRARPRRPQEAGPPRPRPDHRGRGPPLLSRARARRSAPRVRGARRAGQGRARARARRGPARQGRGGPWPARPQRPPHLRGRRRRGAGARRATTSSCPSTRGSSTSPSASSTRRCTPTRRRAARSSSSIPSTGEILALASVPGYNPNDYTDSEADGRRDRAVTDRFEPGSVMKPFTHRGRARGGHAQAHRHDQLRARRLPDRRDRRSTTPT